MDSDVFLLTTNQTDMNVACGDLQGRPFRQAVTAAGSGCMADLQAERYLEEIET